jgi:hypothetical protein
METKQTAVEYLQRMYFKTGMLYRTDFEKAKEMEREQIEDAFYEGVEGGSGELYYKEKYGGQDE